MLHFREALQKILHSAQTLGCERVAVRSAAGRVVGQDVMATRPLPPFDYSAMDGFALDSSTLQGPAPWTVPVRGESRAGGSAPALVSNTACRVFTGAPLPHGADCVVLQEEAPQTNDQIAFSEPLFEGRHVRRRGEDLGLGDVALPAGSELGAHGLALAASLDYSELVVTRKPTVAILCTGDELRAVGSASRTESIAESNGLAIAVQSESVGATARLLPLMGDNQEQLCRALTDALPNCDVLVTIGGASVGKYDLVRPALQQAGAQLDFWKVRIKPGKPLAYGRHGKTLILGLPGNPVSAQVTFQLFGLPLLRALQGHRQPLESTVAYPLLKELTQRPGRMGFYRGQVQGLGVMPLANQASGNVVSLAQADVLIAMPEDSERLEAGQMVDTYRVR